MTTKKLYYSDPYTTEFSGDNFELIQFQNKPAVVFPETYFYPTSGGQEHDTGKINEVEVCDVVEENGIIYHILEKGINPGKFTAEINWKRRFENMQQHTGQHLLSRAFENCYDLDTVSSRLGDEINTIDLNTGKMDYETIHKIENYVNEIIWSKRNIKIHFADEKTSNQFPLRSAPKVSGLIRIIEVENYDFNACGGTHCTNTGEVGIIKITKWEKIKGGITRLDFHCGNRALKDYQTKIQVANELASKISAKDFEVLEQVQRLVDSNRDSQKKIQTLNNQLIDFEAKEILNSLKEDNGKKVFSAIYTDKSAESIRLLAQKMIQEKSVVALLGCRNEKLNYVFARSADLDIDFREPLPKILDLIEGKGGGKPDFVQFGGNNIDKEEEVILLIKQELEL